MSTPDFPSPIHLRAAAKLTKTLRVTGVRDGGMHTIEAEMVELDLFDEILVFDSPDRNISFDGPFASNDIDPLDNLVTRAADLAGLRGLRATVTKNIPSGAGLGGGSADAAAILRWAGYTDTVQAASIGADVAFCLVGGRAMVRGIGEIVEPLPFEEAAFTVVTPPVHCSTPAVYRKWDDLGGPTGDNGNDLEPAAMAVAPELGRYRDALGNATGLTPRLAGSGSSWFVEGDFPEAGEVLRTVRAIVPSRYGISN